MNGTVPLLGKAIRFASNEVSWFFCFYFLFFVFLFFHF